MNIFSDLQYNELDEDMKFVADSCGMDTVINMLHKLGGLQFYIPKITKLDKFILRKWRESELKTIKEFAREINVSETYLRKLIRSN